MCNACKNTEILLSGTAELHLVAYPGVGWPQRVPVSSSGKGEPLGEVQERWVLLSLVTGRAVIASAQLLWLWQGCSCFVSSTAECFPPSLPADLFLKQSSSLIDY